MRISALLASFAILILTAAPVSAAPLAAAVSAVAGLISAGGIIGSLTQLALGLALSYGVGLIKKAQMAKSGSQPRGVVLEVRMGDDQPSSFVIGTYATAGIRKYIGTWGKASKTPNAYLTDVIELSCIPHPGISGIWIEDTHGTILWGEPSAEGLGYPVQEFRKDGKDYAWVRFVDGTQTTADPWLVSTFGSHPERPFKTTMIGRGVAFAVVTFRYNTELFSGLPSCLFEMLPMPLYDVRKDSTAGGSGAQRWDDQSTWEPSDNPAVMIYNIKRGIYYGSEWIYGGQNVGAFRLPAANWMAGTNECDRLVNDGAGGQEKQFRGGYEIQLDTEPLSVIDELRAACSARIAEVGGVFKILVGAPGAAIYSFTDDDILVTEEQSYEPFPSLSETHNGIEATYPEPSEKWATKDAPALYSSALEAEDGDRRLATGVEFAAAPFARQVQALMKAMIEEERRFRVHVFYLPPDAFALEPNDVVSWTSARNGYSSKKFLMTRIMGRATFNQFVALKEIDPSDYDPPSIILPTVSGWLGPIAPPSQPIYGWQVEPAAIVDDVGVPRRPSMRISCEPDQDDVRQVRVQVRLASSAAVIFDGLVTYDTPYSWILAGTFLPATGYQARGKFVPFSTRRTEWSDWLDVTTPDARMTIDDVFLGVDLAGLDALVGWAGSATRQLIEEVRELISMSDEAASAAFTDRQTIRRELTSTYENLTASYQEAIVAATGPGSAIVVKLEALEASLSNYATVASVSAIQVQVTENADGITAIGLRADQLYAALGGSSASINVAWSVSATPAGYAARYGIEAAVNDGAYRSASIYLDVPVSPASPTRVVMMADQIIMTDGTNLKRPFTYTGGILYLDQVKANSLSAISSNFGDAVFSGIARGTNSKLVIDWTAATIVISS